MGYKQRNLFTKNQQLELGKRVYELREGGLQPKYVAQRLQIREVAALKYMRLYLDSLKVEAA